MNLKTNINFQSILTNKYVQISAIVLIVINIILLNVFVFIASRQTSSTTNASSRQTPQSLLLNNSPAKTSASSSCASCAAQLQEAIAMIKNIETALSATPKPVINTPIPTPIPTMAPTATTIPTPTPTRTITATPTPTFIVTGVKEYYVLFGSGNSSSSDWSDVSGLQTSIDTTLYPTIKTATFEVGGHTPTGNETIWVRLYNATDNYPIINSDITWVGGGNKFIISSPISLATGNKTYKVQMKTQLSFTSYIDSAKVHLILY